MSDRDAECMAAWWQVSTARVRLMRILVALLAVLLIASVFDEFGQAGATVGFVLAEALVLYVGYGALMRVASPAVREILAST